MTVVITLLDDYTSIIVSGFNITRKHFHWPWKIEKQYYNVKNKIQ